MNKLEQYFDTVTGLQVNRNILDKYEEFGFESEADYKLIVDFLMNSIYNFEWSDTVADIKTRPNQKQFANLVGQRDTRCVITGRIKGECVASHIVEVKNGGDFDVDNGLLLESGLHQTFDKQLWCINPDTLRIEVSPHHDQEATIRKYEGKKINFTPSAQMIANFKIRYQDYLAHKMEQQGWFLMMSLFYLDHSLALMLFNLNHSLAMMFFNLNYNLAMMFFEHHLQT